MERTSLVRLEQYYLDATCKMISNIVSTLVVLMFASVMVYYFGYSLGAHCAL